MVVFPLPDLAYRFLFVRYALPMTMAPPVMRARLIQKIYEVDPLVCPKCKGAMRISSSSEDPSVIRVILDHLGIWLVRSRPPPKIHDPPIREYAAVNPHLQTHADDFYGDPDYPRDEYIQS